MNPIIRKATLDDLPVLLQFEQGVIEAERPMDVTIKKENITYYSITDLIENDDSEVYVAEIDSQIVASGYAKIKTDRHYLVHDYIGYLGFMFVLKAHRGKGINQLITKALLDWCRQKNIDEIRLDVYEQNPSAIKAYEKVGFKKHMIAMRLNLKDC